MVVLIRMDFSSQFSEFALALLGITFQQSALKEFARQQQDLVNSKYFFQRDFVRRVFGFGDVVGQELFSLPFCVGIDLAHFELRGSVLGLAGGSFGSFGGFFTPFWSILGEMASSVTIKTKPANGAILYIMFETPTIVTPLSCCWRFIDNGWSISIS